MKEERVVAQVTREHRASEHSGCCVKQGCACGEQRAVHAGLCSGVLLAAPSLQGWVWEPAGRMGTGPPMAAVLPVPVTRVSFSGLSPLPKA